MADARAFSLHRRFGLVLAPMQTVQLLGGEHDAFVACAAAHLAPGGVLAAALAHPPPYEGELRPLPGHARGGRLVFSSQPTAIRRAERGFVLERLREAVSPGGERSVERDEIALDATPPEALEAAGRAHGLSVLERRAIPESEDYVGSEVVVLRA